jgi:hypothetical protein
MNNEDNTSLNKDISNVYYDHKSKCYWVEDDRGIWISFNETSLKRLLKQKGFSTDCGKNENLSELDETILQIQTKQNISYAASLAGYSKGIQFSNGSRILVTDSPLIIQPKEGAFPLLQTIIDGMFNHPDIDQRPYFYGWVKIAYECMRECKKRPGQVLAIAGEANSGKSLIQNLITKILGGRAAKPYLYMSGRTAFNAELFQAEHLMIEDEVGSTDLRTRRNFGMYIKQFTVDVVQSCHPKHLTAISLEPFWRVTITLNDEPEAILILPPFDASNCPRHCGNRQHYP